MAVTRIDIETFLSLRSNHPVIDVRSEGEYQQAHIPGALSMPLFNNEERKVVGTAYKKQSKQQAIKIGLDIFGKKMVEMIEFVEHLFDKTEDGNSSKTVFVHCWRGGMRSGGVSTLLDIYGFKVYTIVGGYKAFRTWVLEQFEKDYPLRVLGGYTGSGKTELLHELQRQGFHVIDLEQLANHKGSAFGHIDMPPQPGQEMFENEFALRLFRIGQAPSDTSIAGKSHADDAQKAIPLNNASSPRCFANATCIWLEDESQRLGHVNIPSAFYKMMRNKPIYFLDIPFAERLKKIMAGYGRGDKQEQALAIGRIQKKLGGLDAKNAVQHLLEGNVAECAAILLKYYDKLYLKGLKTRENLEELLTVVHSETTDPVTNAKPIFADQQNMHV